MVDLATFRGALKKSDVNGIIDDFVLSDTHEHVSPEDKKFIRSTVAQSYGVDEGGVEVFITGSAHLGFSLVKKSRGGVDLPRYRPFSAESDVDVAIVSPDIQRLIWLELTSYFTTKTWFPPAPGKLGSYLSCGWFRPDKFPRSRSLIRCRTWFETFNKISSDRRFYRRSVNGGLFASVDQFSMYSARAIRECISDEVTP